MSSFIPDIIDLLQLLPAEVSLLLIYIAAISLLFLFFRLFEKEGLIVFSVLAAIIPNIQVFRGVDLWLFDQPVAMGTVLFTTSFLATDLLTEYYGPNAAQKAVWLSFFGMLMLCLMMILTIGTRPLNLLSTPINDHFNQGYEAIKFLFTPAPRLFFASLIAYLISQYLDIYIFQKLKQKTHGRLLGLRSLISTLIATLVDNMIFSIIAWRLLNPLPLDWSTLLITYGLGTYALRVLVTLLNFPWIYMKRNQDVTS